MDLLLLLLLLLIVVLSSLILPSASVLPLSDFKLPLLDYINLHVLALVL